MMYTGAKEAKCNSCDHHKVCSLKKEFIAAQQAVDNVHVSLENCAMKNLRDFDWIKPVELNCIHFTPNRPTTRDISKEKSACSSSSVSF